MRTDLFQSERVPEYDSRQDLPYIAASGSRGFLPGSTTDDITRNRGKIFTDTQWAPALIATTHPSAILRVPNADAKEEAYRHFISDLKIVRREMEKISRAEANSSASKHAKALRQTA